MSHRSRQPLAVTRLLAPVFKWQVKLRWYVFAVTYMIGVKLIVATMYRVSQGAWPEFGSDPLYLMVIALVFSTPAQAGEEIGWRGYALPRLGETIGFRAASILLGMIWAVWHLPLFLMATDYNGQPFTLFFLVVTAFSVAMTWLYLKTNGSLLLLMLMHASINNTMAIVPVAAHTGPGTFSLDITKLGWFTIAVVWVVAALLLWRMQGAVTLYFKVLDKAREMRHPYHHDL